MNANKFLRFSLIFVLLSCSTTLFAQIQTFSWQNQQRQYIIKTPTQVNGNVPIVFFLHGLGDNITRLDNEFHFQQIADTYCWIVVAPQALNGGMGAMWNAGLTSSSTDDAGFLMALLDTLAAHHPVDLDSVFFTGFSMGGFMSHRMAIEHGDRINACAPVSGLITHAMDNLTPVAPVKMLHIHGTTDPVVGYDGGSQYFGSNLGLSVESILSYWQNANGCATEPVIDTFPDLRNDGLRFVRYTYEGDVPLEHIKVIGGVHTWYHSASQYDISYFEEIHRFFTSGSSAPVSIEEVAQPDRIKLWPNPTTGKITIDVPSAAHILVVDIQGRILSEHRLTPAANQIDLSHLPAGVYILKDISRGAAERVIINNESLVSTKNLTY